MFLRSLAHRARSLARVRLVAGASLGAVRLYQSRLNLNELRPRSARPRCRSGGAAIPVAIHLLHDETGGRRRTDQLRPCPESQLSRRHQLITGRREKRSGSCTTRCRLACRGPRDHVSSRPARGSSRMRHVSRVQVSHSNTRGFRLSNESQPPGRSESCSAWRASLQSSSLRKNWATWPLMMARSTSGRADPPTRHPDPGDRLARRALPRLVEHPPGGIDTNHTVALSGERTRDQTGSAPEIEDRRGADFGGDRRSNLGCVPSAYAFTVPYTAISLGSVKSAMTDVRSR